MKDTQIEKRIQKLKDEITRLRMLYHVENTPDITDDVYDSLSRELELLLASYPQYRDTDGALSRVAGSALDKFNKVRHERPMLSLGNVFSRDELYAWDARNRKLLPPNIPYTYFSELKFDGLAISLIYIDGVFVRGATRGDGAVGEDITSNLKMIESIPLKLKSPYPAKIEVRGEAIMRSDVLERLNQDNIKHGKELFANSRNAAAGSLRQLDPKLTQSRKLDFFAYEIAYVEGDAFKKSVATHSGKHALLARLGFMTDAHTKQSKTLDEVYTFIEKIEHIREQLPFGIDGVVTTIDDTRLYDTLGVVGKDPRATIAYKYPPERATTVVTDITVNVGRTGVLTPLAHFSPTVVAGSKVSKATLHNMDQIERLDIRIGDTVVIHKAGDVIPEVVEVLTNMRTGKEKKFTMPKKCPVCGANVEKKETDSKSPKKDTSSHRFTLKGSDTDGNKHLSSPTSSVAYYCTNPTCPAKNRRSMQHFVNVFEIYAVGPKILDRLKDEGLISDAADLFTLEVADVSELERFGEKSAENIISSIASHRSVPLWRFIYALGIVHVGEQTAHDVADHFKTLAKVQHASVDAIQTIPNIGPKVAESIALYFSHKENMQFIEKLLASGVSIHASAKKGEQKFLGKVFVLTGTLPTLSRDEAKQMILDRGGKVSSSVSKKTSFVVAGADAGSKYTDAQKLNIPILDEQAFKKLI